MLSRRWVALALPFAACFYDWDDGPVVGSGGGPPGHVDGGGGAASVASTGGASSSSQASGGGGSGGCLSCSDVVMQCGGGECPDPVSQLVCPGDAETALEAVVDCVCPTCQPQCSYTCSNIGNDDPGCDQCLVNQAMTNCNAQLNVCLMH
ncbi:MAG TPA: hypothetical protein VFB62_16650 [Polyangiaceae bacterium]|jgi:hypothetical protein|nr:hypothetical protein [Polyangiaceae bacterium]